MKERIKRNRNRNLRPCSLPWKCYSGKSYSVIFRCDVSPSTEVSPSDGGPDDFDALHYKTEKQNSSEYGQNPLKLLAKATVS